MSDFPAWVDAVAEEWINTGALMRGLKKADIRPSQYYAALAADPTLAEHMSQVEKEAERTIEWIAVNQALTGRSDKLFAHLLKGRDNKPLKLTDAQLEQRLTQLLARMQARQVALSNRPTDSPTGVTNP